MKKEQIGRHNWDSALAWHTWKRDQHIDISKEDWGKALNLVHKSKVPNRPKWHSLTIFLRTVWTNKKKYLSTHNEGDKYCNLCVTEIQDTFHLYYNCKITKRLFTNVSLMVKDLCNLNLPIHPNSFLFHNFDDVKGDNRSRLSAIVTMAKFTIWKCNIADIDPNPSGRLMWLKFVTSLTWMLEVNIKCNYDEGFWKPLKRDLEKWRSIR